MDKKEEFKAFVRNHPELVSHVKNGSSTWQKFYEIYDLYGEDEAVWKNYFEVATTTVGVGEIFNMIKSINLDELQNGVNSIERVLGLLGDMTNKKSASYKPRPVYRKFDD